MLGTAPFVVPARWHTHIIDWRERLMRKRLMTRQDLADFDTEIRDLEPSLFEPTCPPVPWAAKGCLAADVTARLRSRQLKAEGDASGLARLVPMSGCGEHPW